MLHRCFVLVVSVVAIGCGPSSTPVATPAQPAPTAQPDPTAPTVTPGPTTSGWETVAHDAAGVLIDLPSNWPTEEGEEGMMVVSPDDEAFLVFLVVDANEIEAALDEVDQKLSSFATDIEAGEPEMDTVNGLQAMFVGGHGLVNGAPVLLGMLLVETPSGQVLLVVGVALMDTNEENTTILDQVLGSIRPIS